MTDETNDTTLPAPPVVGTVSVSLEQTGRPATTATATATPATSVPMGPGWTVLSKFLEPSAIAAIAATAVGLWMMIKDPDREVTAWALIAAGGLLVPALGTIKRLTGGMVGK